MGYPFAFFLLLLVLSSAAAVLLATPAERIAQFLRLALPLSLAIGGGLLLLAGRFGLALPLLFIAATLWRRNRGVGSFGSARGQRKSTVRSAMFEMELDHDTGEMDGVVLTGELEGSVLSKLSEEQLFSLLRQVGADGESAALLEAYLDRRVPGWREDTDADAGPRHRSAPGSGPMTKEEAYQILGLRPGASIREIREAHRRLMKKIHPDSGGSNFLASKINEAKEVLLG